MAVIYPLYRLYILRWKMIWVIYSRLISIYLTVFIEIIAFKTISAELNTLVQPYCLFLSSKHFRFDRWDWPWLSPQFFFNFFFYEVKTFPAQAFFKYWNRKKKAVGDNVQQIRGLVTYTPNFSLAKPDVRVVEVQANALSCWPQFWSFASDRVAKSS